MFIIAHLLTEQQWGQSKYCWFSIELWVPYALSLTEQKKLDQLINQQYLDWPFYLSNRVAPPGSRAADYGVRIYETIPNAVIDSDGTVRPAGTLSNWFCMKRFGILNFVCALVGALVTAISSYYILYCIWMLSHPVYTQESWKLWLIFFTVTLVVSSFFMLFGIFKLFWKWIKLQEDEANKRTEDGTENGGNRKSKDPRPWNTKTQ